jgi:adenylyltransferase/sulfurtransferase
MEMNNHHRYHRQMILKNFGELGQQKLLQAKVLVVGAGGLGCPALQYLAGAGIGEIGIVDDDKVSLSNLHRQILFSSDDIGLPKAEVAARKLHQLNSEIKINVYNERLNVTNAVEIISAYDVIIDGTDNFESRYLINDACVLLNKPLVYGAVSQYEGQIAMFNISSSDQMRGVHYRDLFPKAPAEGEVMNCEEAGVLGVLPGIIGAMQASEAIKFIVGTMGNGLRNRLLTYNVLNHHIYEMELTPNLEIDIFIPQTIQDFQVMDYAGFCGIEKNINEIDIDFFNSLIQAGTALAIDVRELGETPFISEFPVTQMPLSTIQQTFKAIEKDIVVTICQTGKRSLQAAKILSTEFGESKKIYSLKGGLQSIV